MSLIPISGFDLTTFHICLSAGSSKQRSSAFGLSTKYTRTDAHVTHRQKAVNTERFALTLRNGNLAIVRAGVSCNSG